MPIRVRIDVNGRPCRTLWIGRLEGQPIDDWVNTYAVCEGTDDLEGWNTPGRTRKDLYKLPQFEHRYGDGLEVCVEKGITTWNRAEGMK